MTIQLQTKDLIDLLNEIALSASSQLPYYGMLSNTLEIVSKRLDVESSIMFALDETDEKFHLAAFYGMDVERAKEVEQRRARGYGGGGGTSAEVFRREKTYYISDMSKDLRFSDYGNRYPELNRRSFANIPCKSSTKMPLTIALVTKIDQQFQPDDIPILEAVAYQIGLLLEKSLLVKEAKNCEWQATMLYEISRQINASLDINQILEALADGVQRLLAADSGFVGLPDATKENLIIRAASKKYKDKLINLQIPLNILENNQAKPINVSKPLNNLAKNPPDISWIDFTSIFQQDFTHIIGYPIIRGNRPIGLVCAANFGSQKFSEGQYMLLSRLSLQVSTAIENAYLHQQIKSLAVLEERNRLAAEMHDNLAQSIGACKLLTAQAASYIDRNKTGQARSILSGLVDILESAYIDIRESIFNLSSSANLEISFLDSLREYSRTYQAHYGITTSLDIDENATKNLNGYITVQIDRIIKEALTNSRKHSHATKVEISIKQINSNLVVLISDDGVGFSPETLHRENFNQRGVSIMQERAKSIDGELQFTSAPGEGTIIELLVPINKHKEDIL